MESTMFIQLTDKILCKSIASEMIRATKTEGFIMLIDWRYSKPWDKKYQGLSLKRLKSLFEVGNSTTLISIKKGALIPVVGRFVSRYCPAIYFILQAAFPFLVGQVSYLLNKSKTNIQSF
jgi:hypothetical protein